MHSIVIKLGDNDFHRTFVNLLDTINKAIDENDRKPFTEAEIIDLIKRGTLFHYIAFQNQYRYNCTHDDLNNTQEYLSKLTIMFDDKADAYYKAGDQNGEAWHLDISTGMINSF